MGHSPQQSLTTVPELAKHFSLLHATLALFRDKLLVRAIDRSDSDSQK